MPINTHLIFSLKAQCSKPLQKWVTYPNPLTDKLYQATGNAELEFLSQQWLSTDLWSKTLLDIKDTQILQREILMKSNSTPYWYARTIIPKVCYELDPSFFERLQKETMKELIFNEPRVQRINAINYPADEQCVEFYWVKKYVSSARGIFWVRIAEFSFQQKASFYLVEVMLPELGDINL